MPRIKVKKRTPPRPEDYCYIEQVGPNDWAVVEWDGTPTREAHYTAEQAIEAFQARTVAEADLLANDATAARGQPVGPILAGASAGVATSPPELLELDPEPEKKED